jgi:hypothetical protein
MCFEYDGYPEFNNTKIVTTRKPHRCYCCGQSIEAGSQAEYSAGKFDGRFYAFYICDDCKRKQLSIAAEEIRHGCNWNEAWCAYEDVHGYLAGSETPILKGSIDDCIKQVNDLWREAIGKA